MQTYMKYLHTDSNQEHLNNKIKNNMIIMNYPKN